VSIGAAIAGGLVAVAVGLPGCSADKLAAGCIRPPDEPGLLDLYTRDPVLANRPDGAQRVSLERSEACHVAPDWPDDPTETAVHLRLSVPHQYGLDALTEVYQAAVAAEGWKPVPAPTETYGNAALRYCKQVRGVTSYLLISAPDLMPQARVIGPGGSPVPQPSPPKELQEEILVRISAAPSESACPEDN